MWFVPTDRICAFTRCAFKKKKKFRSHRQTDRRTGCVFSLFVASTPCRSAVLSVFFWGKWWHIIKVISFCYTAHLGQLEETLFCVVGVSGGRCGTLSQRLAIKRSDCDVLKCLSCEALKGSAVAMRHFWREPSGALLFWRLPACDWVCVRFKLVYSCAKAIYDISPLYMGSCCFILRKPPQVGFRWGHFVILFCCLKPAKVNTVGIAAIS